MSRSITEIDKNFEGVRILEKDLEYFDALSGKFEIEGLYEPLKTQKYIRLPEEFLNKNVNEGVKDLMYHTSGGKIRFSTNSPYIALKVEIRDADFMMHMPCTGSAGFDIYGAKRGTNDFSFMRSVFPYTMLSDESRFYDGFLRFSDRDNFKEHEVMINMPLYNGVNTLYIGVKEGCEIFPPKEHNIKKTVAFYGSSITQGGCASRPGNNYPAHLSRWMDFPFVCLGFSGSAKGEIEIAEYIANLDLGAFVLDYDYNSTPEELEERHYPFYKKVREKHPDIPIIMMSSGLVPVILDKEKFKSRNIILDNYRKGIAEGDRNLYFIDGELMWGLENREDSTVDYCHPNDLGFYRMAKAVYPVLKSALLKNDK